MNKKIRYLIAGILLIGIVLFIASLFVRYNINSSEIYFMDQNNLIHDGSFENFNKIAGDCCKVESEEASIFASKSTNSFQGNYSLNLTSNNRCACVNFPITDFSNLNNYFLSFYYKGDNPKFCSWVSGDNKCLPVKFINSSVEWKKHNEFLGFTELSTFSSLYLYADSRDKKKVTNLYDDLQVHKLIPIENPSEYEYYESEEYIFRTKADNNVKGEMISDIDTKTGEAYFLAKGKPYVTLKFPWSEIVIIAIMIIIIVRLLFKKQVLQTEKEIKTEVDKIIKSVEK